MKGLGQVNDATCRAFAVLCTSPGLGGGRRPGTQTWNSDLEFGVDTFCQLLQEIESGPRNNAERGGASVVVTEE